MPVALVCQYQVSPAGGVPFAVSVTPGIEHWGESDVGLPGSFGTCANATDETTKKENRKTNCRINLVFEAK